MSRISVDYTWIIAALHLACGYARRMNLLITMVHLIPVPPGYLGTNSGYLFALFEDRYRFREYCATAEDYGVPLICQPMQYISMKDAVVHLRDENAADAQVRLPPTFTDVIDFIDDAHQSDGFQIARFNWNNSICRGN